MSTNTPTHKIEADLDAQGINTCVFLLDFQLLSPGASHSSALLDKPILPSKKSGLSTEVHLA